MDQQNITQDSTEDGSKLNTSVQKVCWVVQFYDHLVQRVP